MEAASKASIAGSTGTADGNSSSTENNNNSSSSEMEVSSPRGDGSKGTQLYCIAVFFVYFYIFEYCLLPPNQLTVSYLYNFCYLFIWYFSILFVLTCIEPKRISETTKDYMRSTHRTQESVIQQPTLLKGKYSKCIVWF